MCFEYPQLLHVRITRCGMSILLSRGEREVKMLSGQCQKFLIPEVNWYFTSGVCHRGLTCVVIKGISLLLNVNLKKNILVARLLRHRGLIIPLITSLNLYIFWLSYKSNFCPIDGYNSVSKKKFGQKSTKHLHLPVSSVHLWFKFQSFENPTPY